MSVVLIVGIFTMMELYEQSDIAFAMSLGTIGQSFEAKHIILTVFPWWGNMIATALMFGANNLVCIFYRNMQRDEDNERLAREKVEAEMYYLKYQINPHFLMNTLNNIHALIDIDANSAKRGLIELSDMMRHVVYESSADTIPLGEDIKFIENYIELMRVRYPQQIDIRFNYPQTIPTGLTIPPLVLIVFVENAFKHGVGRRRDSFIHIDIAIDNDTLTAIFCNSVHPKTDNKKGIGLENVSRRLEHIFGNNHSLDIDQTAERYCVTLKIPINYES